MARSSTTYPRKWKSRETTVIRVPERVADDLLRIARRLDESRSYGFREDGNTLVLEVVPVKRVSYTANKPSMWPASRREVHSATRVARLGLCLISVIGCATRSSGRRGCRAVRRGRDCEPHRRFRGPCEACDFCGAGRVGGCGMAGSVERTG